MTRFIPVIEASDFPQEVEDYCDDNEFSTHYDSGVHQLDLDGNVLQKYMEKMGFTFNNEDSWVHNNGDFAEIAIVGT